MSALQRLGRYTVLSDMLSEMSQLHKRVTLSASEWLNSISPHRSEYMERCIQGAHTELDEAAAKALGQQDYATKDVSRLETKAGDVALAALFCRRSGVFPFYLASLIAAGVSAYYPCIEGAELRNAIKVFCGLSREVQLITLIADQYHALGQPLIDERELILRKKAFELGFYYEQIYGGCAQCTIAACFETLGKSPEPLFQAATVLSGGGAVCTDGSCGSYSGALMVLGSFVGRSYTGMLADDNDEAYATANRMGQKLHAKYMQTYGDVQCAKVQEQIFGRAFRLYDPEDVKAFGEAGAHEDKCPSVVASACDWIIQILHSEGFTDR